MVTVELTHDAGQLYRCLARSGTRVTDPAQVTCPRCQQRRAELDAAVQRMVADMPPVPPDVLMQIARLLQAGPS